MTDCPNPELALLLIASVQSALDAGIEHRAEDGRLLTTAKEVLEVLNRDGSVMLKEPRNDTR